jgi:hypothetical protein
MSNIADFPSVRPKRKRPVGGASATVTTLHDPKLSGEVSETTTKMEPPEQVLFAGRPPDKPGRGESQELEQPAIASLSLGALVQLSVPQLKLEAERVKKIIEVVSKESDNSSRSIGSLREHYNFLMALIAELQKSL